MSQTAVEKVKEKVIQAKPVISIAALIEKSSAELGKALPAHMNPERMVRIAHTTLRMNPALYKCNPHSFLAALFQSAQLGLEPNTLGEAWIIPYNVRGQLMAQFQVGYLGFVKLFWNHPRAERVFAEKVYQDDYDRKLFVYDIGTGEVSHRPDVFKTDRGSVIGYYALGQVKDGGRPQLVVEGKEKIVEFAKRFSKCYDRKEGKFIPGTPWAEHFDEMAKKTLLKQVLKPLPKSVELATALAMDETVKSRVANDMIEVLNEADYATEDNGKEATEQLEQTKDEAPSQNSSQEQPSPNINIKSPFYGEK